MQHVAEPTTTRRPPVEGFLGLGVLALSFALPLPAHGVLLGIPSLCPFHNITGIPCPGCGLTRSFVCCAHGHLAEALFYHPLGPLLFAMTVAITVMSLGRLYPNIAPRGRKLALTALAAAFLVTWVVRLAGVFPLPV